MKKRRFGQLTTCVDPFFELTHGSVHLWIGGHMADIPVCCLRLSCLSHLFMTPHSGLAR